jgi:CHAT domain
MTETSRPWRALSADGLVAFGLAAYQRSQRTEDRAALEAALDAFTYLLEVHKLDDHRSRAARGQLAQLWDAHYRITGDQAELDRAVQLAEMVVAEVPANEEGGVTYLGTLALLLRHRYHDAGRDADLDRAIEINERLVDNLGERQRELMPVLNNLAQDLMARFNRDARITDLDRALDLRERALALVPAGSDERPGLLLNLGVGLTNRFRLRGLTADLDRAVEALDAALTGLPEGHPERPGFLSSLAAALRQRAEAQGQAGGAVEEPPDLRRVVELYEEALGQARPGSRLYDLNAVALAGALVERYQYSLEARLLDRTIDLVEETLPRRVSRQRRIDAISLLGDALRLRYDRTGDADDLARGIAAYQFCCTEGDFAPMNVIVDADNWGQWAADRGSWDEAARAFRCALDARRLLYQRQSLRGQKEDWLERGLYTAAQAAYASAKVGDLTAAVIAAEEGRALLLSEALQRDLADLDRLSDSGRSELASRFRQARERLAIADLDAGMADADDDIQAHGGAGVPTGAAEYDAVAVEEGRALLLSEALQRDLAYLDRLSDSGRSEPASPFRQARERLATVAAEYEAVIAEIRQEPGYEHFLALLDVEGIQAATPGATLVYVTTAFHGGVAMVIRSEGIAEPVWLDELRADAVITAVNDYLAAYRMQRASAAAAAHWRDRLDVLTRWCWTGLMGPLLDAIPLGDPVVIIPGGALGFLPLHAAWTPNSSAPTGRSYAIDKVRITYAPSTATLVSSSRNRPSRLPETAVAVEDPGTGQMRLPFAGFELDAIAGTMGRVTRLAGSAATIEGVLSALPDAELVHLACHAQTRLDEPLESGIALADGTLTLRNVMIRRARIGQLAVLSGCETAMVGTRLPDEAIGLPAGFLQAGFGSVVGSLWAVADVSTALLMTRFYRLCATEHLPPADALRQAQRWLRDATNDEKAELLPPYLGQTRGMSATARRIWGAAPAHSHPYYWAPFVYLGT